MLAPNPNKFCTNLATLWSIKSCTMIYYSDYSMYGVFVIRVAMSKTLEHFLIFGTPLLFGIRCKLEVNFEKYPLLL